MIVVIFISFLNLKRIHFKGLEIGYGTNLDYLLALNVITSVLIKPEGARRRLKYRREEGD